MKRLSLILTCLLLIITGYVLSYGAHKAYQWATFKNYRILVGISSYKRPLLLSGQIIRFGNQTYKNYDISVSVKGAPKEWVERMFMQEWKPLMKQGRLFVRFDKNKDQLANLLDTVRDIDLSKYDYFCKVDDDDWYTPDYLESVNHWLNEEDNIAFSASLKVVTLDDGKKSVVMGPYRGGLYGPTMCFSREVMEMVLKLEKNPTILEPYISAELVSIYKHTQEDALLDRIAHHLGKAQMRDYGPPKIVYGRQYPSVTRNKNNEY